MKLISDEEIKDTLKYYFEHCGDDISRKSLANCVGVAKQMQLESCEKELKEKLDKLTVLSDEEIRNVNPDECVCGITDARAMCQAQLDDVKRRLTNEVYNT